MATTKWLSADERAAWVRLSAVLELLPAALDAQLSADSHLTHFEYFTLAMLSEAPDRPLRMTDLAAQTNATLPRLSHVVRRLERGGDAGVAELGELGGERMIDGAMTIVDNENLLQRTHEHQC